MITTRSRFFSNSRGKAVIPSMSGMSTSRMTTSGLVRSTCSMASRPLRSEATTCSPASASIQRTNRPRTTIASSTIITRIESLSGRASRRAGWGRRCSSQYAILMLTQRNAYTNAEAAKRSDQPDLLELGLDDLLVERLHDVLVGAGMQRARDVSDVVLGGAEHDLRPIAVAAAGAGCAGTRSRPSSACSSRAARRRAWRCGRLPAPARRPRPRRSGNPASRGSAAPPCG